MRSVLFTTLLLIFFGCNAPKNSKTTTTTLLNGTWVPIQQEMSGKALPPALFEKQKLVIADTIYTLTAESIDKGVIRLNGDKMDIFGKEGVNAGRHFTAIYKLDANALTICYNLLGNGYPASFATRGQKLYFLSVFKKQ